MPEQVACPSCGAKLRVPESLLGKNVKCPKCQTTFLAETQTPEEPEERVAREPAPARASARRSEPPPDDYEEEGPPPEDELEDEDRPRRSRRRRGSSAAASAVAGPAIAIMVVAPLSILCGIVDLAFRLLNLGGGTLARGPAGSAAQQSGFAVGMFLGGAWDVLSIILPVVMILGAIKMKNLQSYGFAMTTCILAMVPLHCCCPLGIPFGIWGIVMLNKPEVKNAFS